MPVLNIERVGIHDLPKPRFLHNTDACFDISCARDVLHLVEKNELGQDVIARIPTGFIFHIPEGYHMEVYIRSSLARRGYILVNSVGIIDNGYQGELQLLIYDLFRRQKFHFEYGQRIAQGRIVKDVETIIQDKSKVVRITQRGNKGFGSTGV